MVSIFYSFKQSQVKVDPISMRGLNGFPDLIIPFRPNYVLINGDWKEFTEVTHDGKPSGNWDDYKLLFIGESATVKYGIDGKPYETR